VLLAVGLIWVRGFAEASGEEQDPSYTTKELVAIERLEQIQAAIASCGTGSGTPYYAVKEVAFKDSQSKIGSIVKGETTYGRGEEGAPLPLTQSVRKEVGDGSCGTVIATSDIELIKATYNLDFDSEGVAYWVNTKYVDEAGPYQAYIPVSGDQPEASWLAMLEDGSIECRSGGCKGNGDPITLDEDAFVSTGGDIWSSIAIANFDDDLDLEFTVGSLDDSKIWGWDHTGNPLFEHTAHGAVHSSPAVADVVDNNSNYLEIVVGGGTYLYVLDPNAEIPANLVLSELEVEDADLNHTGIINSSPAVVDIDGDGNLEMVVGVDSNFNPDGQAAVYAWNHDFTPVRTDLPGESTGLFARVTDTIGMISLAIADLVVGQGGNPPADDPLEIFGNNPQIVTGDQSGNLYAWYHNGTDYDSFPAITIPGGISAACSPALADIDGDGEIEIVVGGNDNYLYAFNYNGTLVDGEWPYNTGYDIKSSPAIADVAGYQEDEAYDKDLEIVVIGDSGYVHVLHHDGTAVQNWSLQDIGANSQTSPAIVDIDDDLNMEIVVASLDGHLYALGDAGVEDILDLGLVDGSIQKSSPALVVDLDGLEDGKLDVLIGSTDNNIYKWDLDSVAGEIKSGKFRRDIGNTGFYPRAYPLDDRQRPVIESFLPEPPSEPIAVGDTVSFVVTASDTSGIHYIKVYRDNVDMSEATLDYVQGQPDPDAAFSWTPGFDETGFNDFSFIATDSNGLHSESGIITIEVITEGAVILSDGGEYVGTFVYIQEALDYAELHPNAEHGYLVTVPPDVYNENIVFPANVSITVEGSTGNPGLTIIDGGDSARVVTFQGLTVSSTLKGFKLINGTDITGTGGGGIACIDSGTEQDKVYIEDMILLDNTAPGHPESDSMLVQGGYVAVSRCTLNAAP